MSNLNSGFPTYHSRAEDWECDFNGHWNTRFYCRSFRRASEILFAQNNSDNSYSASSAIKYIRFHKELRSGDPVTVRSFTALGQTKPIHAHILMTEDRIAATALDDVSVQSPDLPQLPKDLEGLVYPRGLPETISKHWQGSFCKDMVVELGKIEHQDCGENGELRFEDMIGRLAIASHHHAMAMGFTPEFTAQTSIGRMLVELRYMRCGRAEQGDFLRGYSRMTIAVGKSFHTEHIIANSKGVALAQFELNTLAVDMERRRATDLPQIVLDALEGTKHG